MPKNLKDNIYQLFDNHEADLPEAQLEVPRLSQDGQTPPSLASGVDLSGKPKVLMVMGAGRSGKSTLLRWVVERALGSGNDPAPVLATLDTLRPTLRHFFPGAMVVDKGRGLERLLGKLIDLKRSAAIDFGADQTLAPLLAQLPDLQIMMQAGGIEPVALYTLTPRPSDLTVLLSMEQAGFRPAATALVLNMGTMATTDSDAEFAQIRRHSVYQAAVERGAVEVWMPKLWAAEAVEGRRLGFRQAMAWAGGGGELPMPGMSVFDRSRVQHWLESMDRSFTPIASWLALTGGSDGNH